MEEQKQECLTLEAEDGTTTDYVIEDVFDLEFGGENRSYLVLVPADAEDDDAALVVRYDISNDTVEEIEDEDEWKAVMAALSDKFESDEDAQ